MKQQSLGSQPPAVLPKVDSAQTKYENRRGHGHVTIGSRHEMLSKLHRPVSQAESQGVTRVGIVSLTDCGATDYMPQHVNQLARFSF